MSKAMYRKLSRPAPNCLVYRSFIVQSNRKYFRHTTAELFVENKTKNVHKNTLLFLQSYRTLIIHWPYGIVYICIDRPPTFDLHLGIYSYHIYNVYEGRKIILIISNWHPNFKHKHTGTKRQKKNIKNLYSAPMVSPFKLFHDFWLKYMGPSIHIYRSVYATINLFTITVNRRIGTVGIYIWNNNNKFSTFPVCLHWNSFIYYIRSIFRYRMDQLGPFLTNSWYSGQF